MEFVKIMTNFLLEQLLYQLLMYLPLEQLELTEGKTVAEIVKDVGSHCEKDSIEGIDLRAITAILRQAPELGDSFIGDLSWGDYNQNGKADYPVKGMRACTFTNPHDNTVFLVFRGTPSGAWLDNAKALVGDPSYCKEYTDWNGRTWEYMSPMQAEAMEYVKGVLERAENQWENYAGRFVIGHSKGGNQAQLAMMLYEPYFDIGLSMDGQGMSKEMIWELRETLADQYPAALNKLYGLNGTNDYVHCLGVPLIRAEQTRWFLEYQYGPQILANHFPAALIDVATGELAPFVKGPGPVAAFVGKVSDEGMALEMENRGAVFMTIMGLLQVVQGKTTPVNARDEDWIRFLSNLDNGSAIAFGVILSVMMNTPEGRDLCEYLNKTGANDSIRYLCRDTVDWYVGLSKLEKKVVTKGVAFAIMAGISLNMVTSHIVVMAEIVEALRQATEKVVKYGRDLVVALVQAISDLVKGFLSIFK